MSHSSNSSGYYAVGYGDQTSGAGSYSNPSLRQNYDYEVFLSFSGEDTRYSFCDHLYHKLIDRGISVFRDQEDLIVGQKIDQLLEAIKASKILIPIISLHYASSEWCLKELVQILKCHKPPSQLVLPIFFKVKPSDVREQKGEFGDEFRRLKAKHGGESKLVEESEQAFKEVASLKGEELKIKDGSEAELVKRIVTRIFKELRAPLLVPDCLVGVEKHVDKIKEEIDAKPSKGAMFVVIHGMGGIGKTTLSKVLYNELSVHYESCSFVPDIRESSHRKGMENIQRQIISDVVVDKSIQEIRHVDEGIRLIQRCFRGKRILLLLDDVGSKDQLNKLAGENNWSGSDSIIIVTTRNRDVAVESAHNLSYELTELNADQSYELFSKHAFGMAASCPSEFEFLAREIARTTGGLPLALEVIGSLLRGKRKGFWEETLDKLRKEPDERVEKQLKISYDALPYGQKQIFLDIACFSFEFNHRYAFYMWKSCEFYPEEGIDSLISLSLIKMDYRNRPTMHDQLRDLGRKIVLEEDRCNIGNRSRIWEGVEALKMMEQKQLQGTPNVQALVLFPYISPSDIHCTSRQFEGMTNLRFLTMRNFRLTGDFQNCFPNLRWLRFVGTPGQGEIEECGFNLKKLVILEFFSVKITEQWNHWCQMKDLKVLKLSYCHGLTTNPDFSALKGLEVLILQHCSSLKKIHPSIRVLTKLKELSLDVCTNLEPLPNLPSSLLSLCFHGESMETLPDFSNLTNLNELTYYDSFERRNKVLNLGNLNQLKILCIKHTSLNSPAKIAYSEEDLAEEMDSTSENIGLQLELPKSLVELKVRGCRTLHNFPNLPNMRNLSKISLRDCSGLIEINGLERAKSLAHLKIKRCRKLSRIGDLSYLEKLKTLSLCHCEKLAEIQGLENLTSLESLDLTGCRKIETLPNFPSSLLSLCFHGDSMKTLPDFSNLTNLNKLTYKDKFERRNRALNLGNLNQLKILLIQHTSIHHHWDIFNSEEEVEIENLAEEMDSTSKNICLQLELPISLVKLKVHGCRTLRNFPNLSNMRNLSKISLQNCSGLIEINGLERAESLAHLEIHSCGKLSRIGDLSHLKMLKTLSLCDCEKLTEIRGLENLTSLLLLDLRGCIAFEEFPYLPNCTIRVDSSKEENTSQEEGRVKKKAKVIPT